MNENIYSAKGGVLACAEAFERLKLGAPQVAKHIDLPATQITAGVVSVEAGYDRGYLKKARTAHMGLISLIDAFRNEAKLAKHPNNATVPVTKMKIRVMEEELNLVKSQLYAVLTQNIQLVEKVRALELEAKTFRERQVLKFPPNS
jgi:hypothetical protein